MRVLEVYTRPGCHLCEEALETLARMGVPVQERDITQDDALHRRYLERIPVGVLDGIEIFELEVDEDAVAEALSSPR
jgi:glutaredoxin